MLSPVPLTCPRIPPRAPRSMTLSHHGPRPLYAMTVSQTVTVFDDLSFEACGPVSVERLPAGAHVMFLVVGQGCRFGRKTQGQGLLITSHQGQVLSPVFFIYFYCGKMHICAAFTTLTDSSVHSVAVSTCTLLCSSHHCPSSRTFPLPPETLSQLHTSSSSLTQALAPPSTSCLYGCDPLF